MATILGDVQYTQVMGQLPTPDIHLKSDAAQRQGCSSRHLIRQPFLPEEPLPVQGLAKRLATSFGRCQSMVGYVILIVVNSG